MGTVIPQLAPASEDRVSGAQFIDGSLRFDENFETYLTRTPSSAGNRKTFTLSGWFKLSSLQTNREFLVAGTSNSDRTRLFFNSNDKLNFYNRVSNTTHDDDDTTSLFRDTSSFYHVVFSIDNANTTGTIYINGQVSETFTTVNTDTYINNNTAHYIGGQVFNDNNYYDGHISQLYLIDGLALGPGYFGYTDPITNTWRPKKFKTKGDQVADTALRSLTTVNDGRVFSSTGTFSGWNTGSYPKTELFDGTLYTGSTPNGASTVDSSTAGTFDFGDNIIRGFQNLKINIFVSSNQINEKNIVSVNGVDITQDCRLAGNNAWTTVDLGNRFTSLQSFRIANNFIYVGGFIVDGVIMQDSTTTNLDFGTNGFYLPFDGSAPIGQDQSGKGNDWTPINFGGTAPLEKSTGAKPILDTTPGGANALSGVFGSKENKSYTLTNSSNSSGGYVFANEGTKPTLGMIRGVTYTFDYSAAGSHPLRFATAADAAGSTQYTTGTNTDTSNVIKFTVPHNAPDTLYYYCTNHGGMGNSISVITDESKADKYASNLFLAVPLDGGDDDVSNSVNCTSTTKVATNSSVDPKIIQSHFYSQSHYWSSSSDTLQYAQQGNELVFGTGDYTIECWLFDDSGHNGTNSRCYIFDNRIGGSVTGDPPTLLGYVDGHAEFNFYDGDSTISSNTGSITNRWIHYAVTREGTTTRMFIDGVLKGSSTASTNFTNNGIGVGRATDSGYGWAGYIQDFRVYKGVAKYTKNFIPAAVDSNILPDTPSGVSFDSPITKITDGGAVFFDGSSDRLSLAANTDLNFGTGDFTIEGFFYKHATTSNQTLVASQQYYQSGNNGNWVLRISSGTQIAFASYDGTGNAEYSEFSAKNGVDGWHHFAFVREGTGSNESKFYLNGKLAGSMTVSKSLTDGGSNGIFIGDDGSGPNNGFKGFLSNVRIIKGTALYTSNFTPPTAPLTNITNTKLLCCQSNRTSGAAAVSPNISGVNNGTVWSSLVSGSTRVQDRVANAFNGSTSSPGAIAAYPGTLTFSPGLTSISSVRIYGYYAGSGVTLHVNGAAQSPSSGASFDITISTSTLSSIVWTAVDGSNYMRLDAVVIDGTTLIDPIVGADDSTEVASNFNPFNADLNTVRGHETDHCIWNRNDMQGFNTGDLKNGGLDITHSAGDWLAVRGTKFVSSGKWYYEVTVGNNQYTSFGFVSSDYILKITNNKWINEDYAYGYYPYNGKVYDGSTARTYSGGGNTTAKGRTFGVSLDMDNKIIKFYDNGKDLGVAFDSTTTITNSLQNFHLQKFVAPCAWLYNQSGTDEYNFGQKPFKYPPPDGFQPMNGNTLQSDDMITGPNAYVASKRYKGNGTTQKIDTKFKPDFIWIKRTNTGGQDHVLQDSVKGFGSATKLSSSSSKAQNDTSDGSTDERWGYITDTFANGFNITASTDGDQVNHANGNYSAWFWKAGGNEDTFNIDDVGYSSAAAVKMSASSLNSDAYNTSQRWSNLMSVTPGSFDQAASLAFDGNIRKSSVGGAVLRTGDNAALVTMDLSSNPVTVSSKIVVQAQTNGVYTSTCTVTLDGNTLTSKGGRFHTFNVSGSLTKMTLKTDNGSGRTYMEGMRIDDKELVDDNVTPPNAPTLASTGCSVGTKQGFSIVKFTGSGSGTPSVAHGLSKAPNFILQKDTGAGTNWRAFFYNGSVDKGDWGRMSLNTTDAGIATADEKPPTSKLFFVNGNGNAANTQIAYLWHDVPGLQKFGVYEGDGQTDGPYIHLGFKPAIIILRNIDNYGEGYDWYLYDNLRDPDNVVSNYIRLNRNSDSGNTNALDFLSSGFKLRASTGGINLNAHTIFYAAWAEAAAVNLYGGQSNAR